MNQAGVTAEELLRVLVRRKTRLPAEIGAFVILEACEHLLEGGPSAVSLAQVWISDDGAVSLLETKPAGEGVSAKALHGDLVSLLVASGPVLAPTLMRLIEEGPRGGRWFLRQLRDDLEASLVPLNRDASSRVLARFVREARENREERHAPARPFFQDLDSELNALLGAAPDGAGEPRDLRRASAREHDATVREPVEEVGTDRGEVVFFDAHVAAENEGESAQGPYPAAAPRMTPMSAAPPNRKRAEPPKARALHQNTLPPGASRRPPAGSGLWLGLVLIGLSLGLCALTFKLRPDVLDRLLSREGSGPEVEAEQSHKPTAAPARPRAGDLVLHVSPERAQVLRFMGRGPVNVPHVSVGVAQEFVATKDDAVPTRVILPEDAEWERDTAGNGPTHELAMQLRAKQATDVPLDLGDSLLRAPAGKATGEVGTVRIVTTPKGAKVYQLVGFAPEARIENLPLEDTQEILVFRKGYIPQIKVVAPSDFVAGEGPRVRAELSVKLLPIEKASRSRDP